MTQNLLEKKKRIIIITRAELFAEAKMGHPTELEVKL